jgi:ribosomal protein S18 acetylase RimI-like enzyme
MEYIVREIREEELSRLVEMCKSHADYEQANYNSTDKEKKLRAAIFSKNRKLYCYVVESSSQLVGYYTYTFDFSTWDAQSFLYLDCLYLEPAYRGLKIGEKIFENLIKIAQEHNCVNIQWQTPTFNERAIKFYKRVGALGKDKARFFFNL